MDANTRSSGFLETQRECPRWNIAGDLGTKHSIAGFHQTASDNSALQTLVLSERWDSDDHQQEGDRGDPETDSAVEPRAQEQCCARRFMSGHDFGKWTLRGWCGREDLNRHTLTGTCTSSMRVCQFRNDRELKLVTPTSSNTYLKLIHLQIAVGKSTAGLYR